MRKAEAGNVTLVKIRAQKKQGRTECPALRGDNCDQRY
jgi:hypothetical protein